ncbi:diguanylate cyclase [Pseudodesulfovibrio sp. F-1]|uniref:Diguanylate cyclase n=1 Tax=Pseudodesulfovibrio alkaliphilus TaxID=2661613 RepID=A0A7K1KK38_9BACT|nr:diguanylate cyclase [Pseudodesulfovibrio alkaliphilus]
MKRQFLIRVLIYSAAAALLCVLLHSLLTQGRRNDQRIALSLRLATLRTSIEKEVISNLLRIQGVATFIATTPRLDDDAFSRFASEALRDTVLLKNISAAPDFIIRFVYPMEGNRQALGADYRTLPGQWEQALRAKETGALVVAGPVALIQGGTGLVGRAPVIIRNGDRERFWGLVSAIIDVDRLYDAVGLRGYSDLNLAIRGVDGKGEEGEVFFGDPSLFAPASGAVFMPVSFPSGSWQLAALPASGSAGIAPSLPVMYGLVVLLYGGGLLLSYRNLRKDHDLQRVGQGLAEAQTLAHLGSWEMDFTTKEVRWSDETYRIFGLDRNSYVPTMDAIWDLVHPEDRESAERAFGAAMAEGAGYSLTHRIVRQDGSVGHVLARGSFTIGKDRSPASAMGTLLDITPLKETESALRTREQTLHAMSDASHDAIIMVDGEDTILFWNRAATKLFGHTEQEAIGRKLHPMVSLEADAAAARHSFQRFARTGSGQAVGTVREFTAVRKDGTTFPVERSVSAFELDGQWHAVGILRDITRRIEAREKLESYARRIALASEAGGVGVWEWNPLTDELIWDARMRQIYAIKPGEFSGLYRAWASRVHPEDLPGAEDALTTLRSQGGDWRHEFRILLPDGGLRHIRVAARARKDKNGQVTSIIGINRDITEQRLAEQELTRLATRDSLTGLFSRGHFMELGTRAVEHARRYGEPVSVLMFDADRFKAVNDTYGHDAGDAVLRALAATAADTLRQVDILGRIGGEEFAAVLPQADTKQAMLVAERLRSAIAAHEMDIGTGKPLSVTVSIGVSVFDEPSASLETMLKDADAALYAAKQNGRNRVERG